MEPIKPNTSIASTIGGESVRMGLAADAEIHLAGLLTNVYPNPELAVTREYSCNAADAHLEAGITRPIEVSLPTALRPLFAVRDYGLGLDRGELFDLFGQYGASNKRESANAVGMLGIGCKSALAAVDQFTVVSVKGGERLTVCVSRDDNGAGRLTIVSAEPTTDPAGVEVSVAAPRDNNYADLAADFFAYWPSGSVLLDGVEPEPLAGLQVGERFTVADGVGRYSYGARRDHTSADRFRVVMGGVSYPAPDDFDLSGLNLPSGKRLVAQIPMGSVAFAPSRESLLGTVATARTLSAVLADFALAVADYTDAEIDSAPTKADACRAYVKAREALGSKAVPSDPDWRGEAMPERIEPASDSSLWYTDPAGQSYYGRRQSPARVGVAALDLTRAAGGVWILGFSNETWSKPMREKWAKWAESTGFATDPLGETLIFTDAARVPSRDWLGRVRSVEWETIRKWKDPAAPARAAGGGGGVKSAGTYSVITPAGMVPQPGLGTAAGGTHIERYPAADFPEDSPVYYLTGSKWDYRARPIQVALDGALVAMIPDTRLAKFRRTFPDAIDARAAVAGRAAEWLSALPRLDREAVALIARPGTTRARGGEIWAGLDADQIADPDAAHFARVTARAADDDLRRRWQFCEPYLTAPADRPDSPHGYPLLVALDTYRVDNLGTDILTYVNAAYAATKERE